MTSGLTENSKWKRLHSYQGPPFNFNTERDIPGEEWEKKVEQLETSENTKNILDVPPLFYGLAKPEEGKGVLSGGVLSRKSFSLSKNLIAVSLIVSIFWLGLIIYSGLKIFSVEEIVIFFKK